MVPLTIAVTGANSYIGRHLTERVSALGWSVRALDRSRFDLNCGPKAGVLEGVDVLIHLAWQRPRQTRRLYRPGANESGARKLLEAARAVRVKKTIFVSTQLASPGAVSFYGREKFAVECLFDGPEDTIVRPGFVFGGRPIGFFAETLKNLRQSKFVPLICPEAPIQPIHIDDLLDILCKIASTPGPLPKKVFGAGTQKPVPLFFFLKVLGRLFCHQELRLIPLPAFLLYFPIWCLSFFHPKAMDLSERLGGIMSARPRENEGEYLRRTAHFLQQGLRRDFLEEARALSKYLLGRVEGSAVKGYVRKMEASADARPLSISRPLIRFPALLALVDVAAFSIFRERILLFIQLLGTSPSNKPSLAGIAARALKDLCLFPLRGLAHCFLRFKKSYE